MHDTACYLLPTKIYSVDIDTMIKKQPCHFCHLFTRRNLPRIIRKWTGKRKSIFTNKYKNLKALKTRKYKIYNLFRITKALYTILSIPEWSGQVKRGFIPTCIHSFHIRTISDEEGSSITIPILDRSVKQGVPITVRRVEVTVMLHQCVCNALLSFV